MTQTSVDFAGLKLKNPIIAASAPPTESLENIIKCVEAGSGAIITKTSADYDPANYILGGRRTYIDQRGLWAQGTFRHETLTIAQGTKLVKEATKAVDVPIIASVGSLSLQPKDWLNSCLAMQDAGASMIHLDLFYMPQPRCSPENVQNLREIIFSLVENLEIPVAPKLNNDIPAYYAVDIFKDTGISAIFLIDSIRVPVPINIQQQGKSKIKHLLGARECSLFGGWQKPITLQYTSILYRELGLPICAGGGLMDGWDVIEAMMWGATTTQFATLIIKHGYSQIKKIQKQINVYLLHNNFINRISDLTGYAHKWADDWKEEHYLDARAKVNNELCINCGLCTRVVFCEDIFLDSKGNVTIKDSCDGCGFCPTVCPVPGALEIFSI